MSPKKDKDKTEPKKDKDKTTKEAKPAASAKPSTKAPATKPSPTKPCPTKAKPAHSAAQDEKEAKAWEQKQQKQQQQASLRVAQQLQQEEEEDVAMEHQQQQLQASSAVAQQLQQEEEQEQDVVMTEQEEADQGGNESEEIDEEEGKKNKRSARDECGVDCVQGCRIDHDEEFEQDQQEQLEQLLDYSEALQECDTYESATPPPFSRLLHLTAPKSEHMNVQRSPNMDTAAISEVQQLQNKSVKDVLQRPLTKDQCLQDSAQMSIDSAHFIDDYTRRFQLSNLLPTLVDEAISIAAHYRHCAASEVSAETLLAVGQRYLVKLHELCEVLSDPKMHPPRDVVKVGDVNASSDAGKPMGDEEARKKAEDLYASICDVTDPATIDRLEAFAKAWAPPLLVHPDAVGLLLRCELAAINLSASTVLDAVQEVLEALATAPPYGTSASSSARSSSKSSDSSKASTPSSDPLAARKALAKAEMEGEAHSFRYFERIVLGLADRLRLQPVTIHAHFHCFIDTILCGGSVCKLSPPFSQYAHSRAGQHHIGALEQNAQEQKGKAKKNTSTTVEARFSDSLEQRVRRLKSARHLSTNLILRYLGAAVNYLGLIGDLPTKIGDIGETEIDCVISTAKLLLRKAKKEEKASFMDSDEFKAIVEAALNEYLVLPQPSGGTTDRIQVNKYYDATKDAALDKIVQHSPFLAFDTKAQRESEEVNDALTEKEALFDEAAKLVNNGEGLTAALCQALCTKNPFVCSYVDVEVRSFAVAALACESAVMGDVVADWMGSVVKVLFLHRPLYAVELPYLHRYVSMVSQKLLTEVKRVVVDDGLYDSLFKLVNRVKYEQHITETILVDTIRVRAQQSSPFRLGNTINWNEVAKWFHLRFLRFRDLAIGKKKEETVMKVNLVQQQFDIDTGCVHSDWEQVVLFHYLCGLACETASPSSKDVSLFSLIRQAALSIDTEWASSDYGLLDVPASLGEMFSNPKVDAKTRAMHKNFVRTAFFYSAPPYLAMAVYVLLDRQLDAKELDVIWPHEDLDPLTLQNGCNLIMDDLVRHGVIPANPRPLIRSTVQALVGHALKYGYRREREVKPVRQSASKADNQPVLALLRLLRTHNTVELQLDKLPRAWVKSFYVSQFEEAEGKLAWSLDSDAKFPVHGIRQPTIDLGDLHIVVESKSDSGTQQVPINSFGTPLCIFSRLAHHSRFRAHLDLLLISVPALVL